MERDVVGVRELEGDAPERVAGAGLLAQMDAEATGADRRPVDRFRRHLAAVLGVEEDADASSRQRRGGALRIDRELAPHDAGGDVPVGVQDRGDQAALLKPCRSRRSPDDHSRAQHQAPRLDEIELERGDVHQHVARGKARRQGLLRGKAGLDLSQADAARHRQLGEGRTPGDAIGLEAVAALPATQGRGGGFVEGAGKWDGDEVAFGDQALLQRLDALVAVAEKQGPTGRHRGPAAAGRLPLQRRAGPLEGR